MKMTLSRNEVSLQTYGCFLYENWWQKGLKMQQRAGWMS